MEIIKAIIISFLQYFLIRPDSPYGKSVRTLLVTYPNPFSLEAILWWPNPKLKSICLSLYGLVLKKSHSIFSPRRVYLD